jgi:hypothetical protein
MENWRKFRDSDELINEPLLESLQNLGEKDRDFLGDMIRQYRLLQRAMWFGSDDGKAYQEWFLQTVMKKEPEEAKKEAEEFAREMKKSTEKKAQVIMKSYEEYDKDRGFDDNHAKRLFGDFVRTYVKKDGWVEDDPKAQPLGSRDWTPETTDGTGARNYEEYKKHLETKGQAK